jgi:hypothetical protein
MASKRMAVGALWALLLAVPVGAATFEGQITDASALLRVQIAAVKAPPPPALPDGTPRREERIFADGWASAVRALGRPRCEAYFAERGAPGARPLETLRSTEYRFVALPQGETVGAMTNSAGSVFLNTTGLFVTAFDGGVALGGRDYDLGSPAEVRAMILLHELGHQLGIFGPDSGPKLASQNAAHSRDIIENCLQGRLL